MDSQNIQCLMGKRLVLRPEAEECKRMSERDQSTIYQIKRWGRPGRVTIRCVSIVFVLSAENDVNLRPVI